MNPKNCIILATLTASLGLAATSIPALAANHNLKPDNTPDSLTQWLSKSKITGQFRDYYYTEKYEKILPFKHTNSIGGWLNIHTPGFHGWSVDLGAYTAQSLGLNAHNAKTQVGDLPYYNLTVLGQAYIQYRNYGFKIRAGNQPVDTPFAQSNTMDLRMIPPLFQGIGGSYKTPVKGLSVYAYRMFRFKDWASSSFQTTDTGKGGYNVIAPVPRVSSGGFVTLGAKEHYGKSTAQFWYYDFYNRLSLGYGEYAYKLPLHGSALKALLFGAQYAREWNTGNQAAPYKNVDSTLVGLRVGFLVPHDILFLSYNNVQNHPGAFRGGGFISPYLLGEYDTSTIYTDVFGVALGSVVGSPGHAYGIKDVLKFPKHHLTFIGKYTQLYAPDEFIGTNGPIKGVGTAHSWDFIARYNFAKSWAFKFLYAAIHNNSHLGTIQIGRVYLTYNFSEE